MFTPSKKQHSTGYLSEKSEFVFFFLFGSDLQESNHLETQGGINAPLKRAVDVPGVLEAVHDLEIYKGKKFLFRSLVFSLLATTESCRRKK